MLQVHVDKSDLTKADLVECEQGALGDGAVRLAIESFSVTSNNITYAVVGDGFGYWNFFPAPQGKGIVPMWGHSRVIESNCPEIAVGERLYGYIPMASHLDVVPGKVSASGFTDVAEHRQPMSPIYNQYARLAADPEHDPAREGERMIFGPLFKTGFLIEYFMRSEDWFGAEQLIITSASSKTAMGLASVASHRSPAVRRVGLTSAGNVEFVRSSGLYNEVLSYDALDEISGRASVSVDFAGNSSLLRNLHMHLGENLKYSCLVGVTHIEERGEGTDGIPGPKPTLFFAPDHGVALTKQVGPDQAGRMMAESWVGFLEDCGNSVEIERHSGLDEARKVFVQMVGGSVDPAKGIVIEP
ncbi:MAG: DUF2855 family protein [Erythrobacter sp.]